MPAVKSKRAAAPKPRYGNYVDAAALAHVSVRTIQRWIESGKIRAERDGAAQRVRVRLDDIDKLVRDAAAS